jgi:hypothetical protein
MMEAVSSSEMSVSIYQTARRNVPEDSHLQDHLAFSATVLQIGVLKVLQIRPEV